ncbi:uncharacterized protein VTP21DRAFT_10009 [Calcarisporiella thermophila]|uniref:uncharacterized protein n=1 Tax=Calcarisporiella thermophila TaxID=911321 RepID=UPI003743356C
MTSLTLSTSDDENERLSIGEGGDVVEDFAKQLDELCLNSHSRPNPDNVDDPAEEDAAYSEDPSALGYVQLPRSDDEHSDEDDEDLNECNDNPIDNDESLNSSLNSPPVIKIGRDSEMNKDDLELINAVMKNIQMPESAIPEWAKAIPEEVWMPKIVYEETKKDDVLR